MAGTTFASPETSPRPRPRARSEQDDLPRSDPTVGPTARQNGESKPKFRLTHIPALDGLRGVAVAATVLFHTHLLTGGYLSMAMFFSLSGFLITTVLLEERISTGGIRLWEFWKRRARRLLPALIALLVAVSLYGRFFAPDPNDLGRLRGDTIATIFYSANWNSILNKHGYWELFSAPSLLQHTWSLAIEEQFYVIWPLILGTLLWWRRGSLRALVAFCVAFAVGGAVWMAILYDPEDVSRVYLGTDTRMPALLVGAALAAWLQISGPVRSHATRVVIEAAALVGSAAVLFWWITLEGGNPFVYRGGLFLCSVAGVAVLASVSHPIRGPVAGFLSWKPFCWLGLISYGLYLWHWPVIVVLNTERTGLDGLPLVAVQVGISICLAVISFYALEQPIRRHGFAAWRYRPLAPIAAMGALLITLVLVTPNGPVSAEQQAADAITQADAASVAKQANAPIEIATDEPIARAAPGQIGPGRPIPRPTNRNPRLLLAGDSVALSLGMAIQTEPDRWDVELANRSVVGCSLDNGTGQTRSAGGATRREDPTCQSWPQRWANDVAQFRPDAVLLAFGGLQTDARLLDDGMFHRPCDPYFLQWYRAQWDQALRVLSAGGAVVFVATPAYINQPDRYPDINDGFDCVKPVMRAAVAANPSTRLLPLDTWVCPTRETCRDEENGIKLRFDGAHYAGAGASLANQWILDQVFAPAAR